MGIYEKLDGELLSDKVYRVLKNAINQQKLKPGEKLSEAEIANQMGVSRTPVREALKKLVAKGFAVSSPNQGTVVSTIDLEDVKEVLQIRRVLEGLAAHLCTKKISNRELNRLENIYSQMEYYVKAKDVLAYSNMAEEFHELIFKIAGNNRLRKFRGMIHDIELRFGLKSLNVPGRVEDSLLEHRKILLAIKARDNEDAEEYSQKHVEGVIKNLLENERVSDKMK